MSLTHGPPISRLCKFWLEPVTLAKNDDFSARELTQIRGRGEGIRWPDIDEDISVGGMLRGVPARRGSR